MFSVQLLSVHVNICHGISFWPAPASLTRWTEPIRAPALVFWSWKVVFQLHTVNTGIYESRQYNKLKLWITLLWAFYLLFWNYFYHLLGKHHALTGSSISKLFPILTCSTNPHKTPSRCKLPGAMRLRVSITEQIIYHTPNLYTGCPKKNGICDFQNYKWL